MNSMDQRREVLIARGRHVRLAWYAIVSLGLTLVGYYLLGLDRPRALAYAALAYILLVGLNFRALLSPIEPPGNRR